MTSLLTLALPALACDRVDIDAPGTSIHVSDCDDDAPVAILAPAPPAPPDAIAPDDAELEAADDGGGQVLLGQYGLQFLPGAPGHQGSLRLVGEHDAYVGGELRYLPAADFVGVGRAGAGFDVAGKGAFDLTLGLWVGAAGEWERTDRVARLWGSPILGTEVGLGLDGHRVFARYRWLAGVGGGALDDLLTENEFTFGYKVTKALHLTGQYLVLDPGAAARSSGVGLGLRVAL